MDDKVKTALDVLKDHSDFKILCKVKRPEQYSDLSGCKDVMTLMIVDVETTGLSADEDKIIEVASMLVEFSPSAGLLGRVLDVYDGFEDPGFPLTEETTRLTGITDKDLQGQSFDERVIERHLSKTKLVLAHNAELDRKFLERRFPAFSQKWWICSYKEGPWEQMLTGSAKQDYLLYKVGNAFYEAHRALSDVEGLAHLLASPGVDDKTVLRNLLIRSREPSYRLWAVGAPFEVKDQLKSAGYRWQSEDVYRDGELVAMKCWTKDQLNESQFHEEMARMQELNPRGTVVVDKLSGVDRYSVRIGAREHIEVKKWSAVAAPAPTPAPAMR